MSAVETRIERQGSLGNGGKRFDELEPICKQVRSRDGKKSWEPGPMTILEDWKNRFAVEFSNFSNSFEIVTVKCQGLQFQLRLQNVATR